MTKQIISPDEDSFEEEEEEKLLTAMKCMQSLLEEEKFLKVRKDDNFLLRYLRSSQYNPELAVEKIKMLKMTVVYFFITTKSTECAIKSIQTTENTTVEEYEVKSLPIESHKSNPYCHKKELISVQLFNDACLFFKMRTYYTLKREHPEWYITKEPISSFKSELNSHLYFLLEDRDKFGKRIYINKLGMIDTSKTTMAKQSQLQDFFLESILDEEETQKCGLSIIVDLKNFSWTLLKWLTPSNVCIAVKKIESIPLKKIEFHVVNTSVLLNAAVKLIWPFLSTKTKENIHFHYENWTSLHKTIDPTFLPEQYGGTKPNLNIAKLLQIIPGDKEWLSENLQLGYILDLNS